MFEERSWKSHMFEIYMWTRISPRESIQLDTVQKLCRFADGHPDQEKSGWPQGLGDFPSGRQQPGQLPDFFFFPLSFTPPWTPVARPSTFSSVFSVKPPCMHVHVIWIVDMSTARAPAQILGALCCPPWARLPSLAHHCGK